MKKSKKNNGIWIVILLILAATTIVVGSKFSLMPTTDITYEWFTKSPYNSDIKSRLIYKDTIASPTVKIGDYEITSSISSQSSFATNKYAHIYGCYVNYNVKKNGISIGSTPQTTDLVIDTKTDQIYFNSYVTGGNLINTPVVSDDMNYIRVNQGATFTNCISCWNTYPPIVNCDATQNIITMHLSDDSFDIDIEQPAKSYFVGQNVPLKVVLTNNLKSSYKANLKITYDMPTFFGDTQNIQTQFVDVNPGLNLYIYIIPTEAVVEKFNVTVAIDVIVTPDNIVGVNNNGNRTIASITFDPQTIMLNPLPLVIELNEDDSCEIGYIKNSIGTYCVSDKVKELSCYQIGCPVVDGSEYQCTSAGICAETVYITVWGDCPDGTNETYNAADQKICVDERLFETITQCSTDSDCLDPCEGVVSACILGRCEYQGTCKVLSQLEIKEIIKQGEPEIRYVEPEFDYTKYYLVGLALVVLGFVIAMKIKVLKKKR